MIREVWSLEEMDEMLRAFVGPIGLVLDLGAGLRPQAVLTARRTIRVDAWRRYRPDVVADLRRPLPFRDRSADVCWCSDVIEHLESDDGLRLLEEMARVARRGTVIRTPLGFWEQSAEDSPWEEDREHPNPHQAHLSGWEPEELTRGVPGAVALVIPPQPKHENLWYRHGGWFAVWRPS